MITEERVKEIRDAGLSMEEVAQAMNISSSTLTRVIKGKQNCAADFEDRFELAVKEAGRRKALSVLAAAREGRT